MDKHAGPAPTIRLAELVASLSLATDLGLGLPQEHVLRQTVIATRLSAAAGLSQEEQAAAFYVSLVAFYVSLLAWVGCVADSHELTQWFGDDVGLRADTYRLDKTGLPMMRFLLERVGAGGSPLQRITMIGRFLAGGFRDATDSFVAHCQTTSDIADRLGLPDAVRDALPQAFERWDGRGVPGERRGAAIEPVMRIVQIADDAEVLHRIGGTDTALEMLRSRRGSEFDPALVDLCCADPAAIFGGLDSADAWGIVIGGCAELDRKLSETQCATALSVFADYADLKSTWFLGHSRAVAALAGGAARKQGLSDADIRTVEYSALVARIGAIGVSTGIWEKPGPLTSIEWERVRTVPYLTERVLSRQPWLARLGAIAGMAHERMDGSGYPRGLAGNAISAAARLLAAADVYVALGEARPHRPAFTAEQRNSVLRGEVDAGRLDADAVRAVLAAAGQRVGRPKLVAGLTGREAEVLELLVRGRSNKEIAAQLSITPRTVSAHVEHIYTEIGVSTRGAAAIFAMRHGLVDTSKIG